MNAAGPDDCQADCQAGWQQLSEGCKKFVRQWNPPSDPWASVCFCHGLGEHSGRYENLAQAFCREGLKVFAFDQQGHGQSPEGRGCIESYSAMMDDVESMLGWIGTTCTKPIVLFGHSMGGNIVLNYALRKQLLPACVISSSPMIRAARQPARWMEAVLRLVGKFAPNAKLKSNVRAETLMNDPEEQRQFYADDVFHSKLSLRLGAALLDSGGWLLNEADKLQVPTLLTHGTVDAKTSPEASEKFGQLAGDVCQFEKLEGELHDPFRSLGKDAVIKLFVDFVRTHCDGN
ncbi:MAG: lysophospholipase [Pirellulaceae bacterium]